MWPKRRFLGPTIIGLALVVVLSLSPSISSKLRVSLAEVFSPVQEFLYPLFRSTGSIALGIGRIIRAARVNSQLESENEFLLREVIRLRDMEAENINLRGLIEFKKTTSYKTIGARVIGREVRHWYQSILIDKGSRAGIEPGDAVVTSQGLVGRVVELGRNTSRVLLITDPNCRVGGMLQLSRTPGLVAGDGDGSCLLNYLPSRTEIVSGEDVVTSGMNPSIPPGLLIGKVRATSSEKMGLYQSATIDPLVDFDRISLVMIIRQEVN